MSKPVIIRALLLLTSASLAALTACGASSAPGELHDNQQLLKSCNRSAPPASLVEVDGTGSDASSAITKSRMETIEAIVRRTAVCSGDLKVLVFSSSSAATVTLFDGPLHPYGATDNARLRRVPAMVSKVMAGVRKAFGPAVASLDTGGSDITAQYRLANEWIEQLGGTNRLHLYVLTDGFQNIGVDLAARPLTQAQATALATQVAMPKLPGAMIVVAGLGKVAGTPPRSDVVAGLVAYYTALCKRAGAAQCVAVTDYTPEGQ
jgi:hypothetical protein